MRRYMYLMCDRVDLVTLSLSFPMMSSLCYLTVGQLSRLVYGSVQLRLIFESASDHKTAHEYFVHHRPCEIEKKIHRLNFYIQSDLNQM